MRRRNPTAAERLESQETLRKILTPGCTVHTILRHCARSGMTRWIDLHYIDPQGGTHWLSRLASTACGFTFDEQRECIRVGGCGMDMGFSLVYHLAAVLWPDGFGCIGRSEDRRVWCPSNDHSNGDRDYTPHNATTKCQQSVCWCHDSTATPPAFCSSCGCTMTDHWHDDGGYALTHRWL